MRTIRRGATLLGTVAALSLGAAAPASADFHPACLSFGGNAFVNLKADGSDFVYSMTVFCDDADSITIAPLTLTNFFGSLEISRVTTEGRSCLGEVCTVEGRTPQGPPGLYRVNGSFGVTGQGETYSGVPRCGRWTWLAIGQPSVLTNGGSRTC